MFRHGLGGIQHLIGMDIKHRVGQCKLSSEIKFFVTFPAKFRLSYGEPVVSGGGNRRSRNPSHQ